MVQKSMVLRNRPNGINNISETSLSRPSEADSQHGVVLVTMLVRVLVLTSDLPHMRRRASKIASLLLSSGVGWVGVEVAGVGVWER